MDLDIPARRLNMDLSDRKIEKRKTSGSPPRPKITHGWLGHIAKHAASADKGASLE
jgi:dihydroxy-acid dehydratase